MYSIKGNASNIPKQQLHFGSDDLNLIRHCLSHRFKIEDILTKFDYKENKKYIENVKHLSQTISNVLQLESNLKTRFIGSFTDYISYEQNVPIQINFRKLRYQQFCNLVAEWETSIKQTSILRPSQRLYSIQHRNILFSRIFVEQKQVIENYFEELSYKKMLKGVDLYQLLADILSHYFLYEYLTDNQSFFQKVNSFNNFLQVVNKFINSQTRIIINNKSKDFQYIKLYEFQALIYFWESTNLQLQIRSEKRFSAWSKEVQTESHKNTQTSQQGVQTTDPKDKVPNLDEIINGSLKSLNKLTQIQNDPEKLEIIQNIFESLRKEKIKLTQYQKTKNTRKRSESSRQMLHINSIDSRFLDAASQQSDIELQKTQRILKGYASPDQLRESASKRKIENNISLDRTFEVNDKGLIKLRVPEVEKKKKSPEKLKHVEFHSFSSENNEIMLASSSSQTKPVKIIINSESQEPSFDKRPTFMEENQQPRIQTQPSQKSGYSEYQKSERKQEKRSMLSLLQMIYNHYADQNSQIMDANKLHQFFVDIGIIAPRDSLFELKVLRLNPLRNLQNIKQIQFLEIMGLVVKDDEDLTYEVISEFVDMYVKKVSAQKMIKSQFERQKYDQSRNVGNKVIFVDKETYGNSLLKEKETYKIPQVREKEAYQRRRQKSGQKLYPKYPEISKQTDPYYKVNGSSFEREKSKDGSSRKRRYIYSQQTSMSQNEDYLAKLTQFGNNNSFYR